MATLAGQTWLQGFEVQLAIDLRISCMTTEAGFLIIVAQFASESFLYVVWRQFLVTGRYIQTIDGRVVTHNTLVRDSATFQDPGLSACPKTPSNRDSDGSCSVGHTVCALVAMGFDDVGE